MNRIMIIMTQMLNVSCWVHKALCVKETGNEEGVIGLQHYKLIAVLMVTQLCSLMKTD